MKDLIDFLLKLNHIQETLGYPCYFVGGCVRDALLGIGSLDLDLAVDGPVEPFSEALEGASLSLYGTARFYVGTYHVDLASFRNDTYDDNSGLPSVAKAGWELDLMRRDFTVNTAYVPLNVHTIDRIVSQKQLNLDEVVKAHPLFGEDLLNKKIRALQDRTFEEDPSRMLRAIKYKVTLGFSFEKHTAELMSQSDKDTLMGGFSHNRFKRILCEYAHHNKGFSILFELSEYKLLKNHFAIDAVSKMDQIQLKDCILRVQANSGQIAPGLVALLALYKRHLTYWSDANKAVREPALSLNKVLKQFESSDAFTDVELYKLFDELSPEALAVCLSKDIVGEKIYAAAERFFSLLKDIKRKLTGWDLICLGFEDGPNMGKMMADLLDYEIENHINLSKEEEIKWIESKMNANRH